MAGLQEHEVDPWDAPDPGALPLSVRKAAPRTRAGEHSPRAGEHAAPDPPRALRPPVSASATLIPEEGSAVEELVAQLKVALPAEAPAPPAVVAPVAQPAAALVEATVEFDGQWGSDEGSVPTFASGLDEDEELLRPRLQLWKLGLSLVGLTAVAMLAAAALAAVAAAQIGTLHPPGPRVGTTLPDIAASARPSMIEEAPIEAPAPSPPRSPRSKRAAVAPLSEVAPVEAPTAPAEPEPAAPEPPALAEPANAEPAHAPAARLSPPPTATLRARTPAPAASIEPVAAEHAAAE